SSRFHQQQLPFNPNDHKWTQIINIIKITQILFFSFQQ
ncbi:unnamed protein product, partial [Rotaria magnacalcarata]